MRICLVSNEFAPLHGSGVGVYAAEAARAWRDAGHEVHAITGDHAGLAEHGPRLFPGVIFHPVDLQSGAASDLPEPLGAVQWPLGAYERLVALHAAVGLDYAEFPDFGGEGHFAIQGRRLLPGRPEGLPGCVLGVRLHMPAMLIDAMNQRTWRGRLRAYLAEMEQGVLHGADVVWAPCRAVAEALREIGVRVHDSPTRPVVVSRNPFTPPEPASQPTRHTRENSQEIVFVGRLERRKGPDVLLRAAIDLLRERPALRVRLLGGDTDTGPLDGSVVEWLEKMIPSDLRGRLVLEGQRPREECLAAVAGAAVVCFPARWDNWPYAVLEAMAAGACIVASIAGGHAEMLEDGATAVLVRAGDAEALATSLRSALDDPALRGRLGAAARQAAARLGDPGAFSRQTLEVIESIRAAAAESPPTIAQGSSRTATAVTVVIPHRDMPDELPDALESLARQTARGLSVILVDDGSSNPRAIELLDRVERDGVVVAGAPVLPVRILRQSNAGPAAARNAGIAATSTPLVVTLDADDILAPSHIEKCVAALAARPELACVGALVSYFDESPDRPTGSWAPLGLVRDMLPAMNTMGTGSGIMFRRETLATLRPRFSGKGPAPGPFDPGVPGYEDWDLYCALAAAGHRGEILPEALIHYRVRAGSRYHGTDRLRHDRLVAELAARHPGLAERPDRAMRLLLAESRARQQPARKRMRRLRRERDAMRRRIRLLQERLESMRARLDAIKARRRRRARVAAGSEGSAAIARPALPMRYRAADRLAGALRTSRLSGPARRMIVRLRGPR